MKSIIALLIVFAFSYVVAQDELSLFDAQGQASAYIVADDNMTIYLWSGEPVAYLVKDNGRDSHVYGFNGKHLGWFVNGIIRDHQGNAACALKDVISNPQLEPLKSLKSLKPLKNLKELPPLRPLFVQQWSGFSCKLFLSKGKS